MFTTRSTGRNRKPFFLAIIVNAAALISILTMAAAAQDDGPPRATDEAIVLFNKGQDEHGKGNLKRAVELYDNALTLVPEFAEAEFQRGSAMLVLGNLAESERSFRRAVEIRPEWTLALAALGKLLVDSERFEEAETVLAKAIKLDDMSFPAYAGMTELRVRTNSKPDQLRPLLEKMRIYSTKASPTAGIWTARASLEIALGDRTSAKTSLARALEIDPENKGALYYRADVAIAEGDLVRADEIARVLGRLDPDGENLVILKARIAAASGKMDEARRALASLSSPSRLARSLIDSLAETDRRTPADVEKRLETEPRNADLLAALCSAYRVSDPSKAMEYCRRASEVEPTNISHAIGYGAALVQAGKHGEAVELFRKLLSLAPDNATIHANLGTALFQLKRYEEAKTEYRWLTSKQPQLAVAYYFLAICNDQLNEYLDAAANYQLFIKYADAATNKLEIEKVQLRLPVLQKELKQTGGRSSKKNGP
jgi:tetratricopeptide (TPR) repeat protein